MTAHARNAELLERVMQHIDDHPELHEQWHWFNECGTAACFAGWTCLLGGLKKADGYSSRVELSKRPLDSAAARDAACQLLGLDDDEAELLFHAGNTRDELRLMVKDLVNGDQLRTRDEYDREAGEFPW